MRLNSRIRVLQLGSPTGLFGAERWILALMKQLDPSNVESVVATVKDASSLDVPICCEAGKLGFRTHVFEAYGKANWDSGRQLRRFVCKEKINILHTHGYKTDIIGLLGVQGTSCRIVSTPHGWTQDADFKLRVYEIADRIAFQFFDAVVPLSYELYRGLRRIPGLKRKLHVIENGVDVEEISRATKTADEIERWKHEGTYVVGFVGRLVGSKGVDVLLKAVASLNDPDLRLAVVGEGEERQALEAFTKRLSLQHRVKFFGYRSDRLNFIRGFDIFVLPSRSEGTPRSVMEAMAAGTSVVVSDCEGCKTLVSNEESGLIFRVNNERQLAHCIRRLKEDKQLRDKLTANAIKGVNEKFSSERMAREYSDLYRKLAFSPHGRF